jgi:hypothetical protein
MWRVGTSASRSAATGSVAAVGSMLYVNCISACMAAEGFCYGADFEKTCTLCSSYYGAGWSWSGLWQLCMYHTRSRLAGDARGAHAVAVHACSTSLFHMQGLAGASVLQKGLTAFDRFDLRMCRAECWKCADVQMVHGAADVTA